jgi:hypothetical protein
MAVNSNADRLDEHISAVIAHVRHIPVADLVRMFDESDDPVERVVAAFQIDRVIAAMQLEARTAPVPR